MLLNFQTAHNCSNHFFQNFSSDISHFTSPYVFADKRFSVNDTTNQLTNASKQNLPAHYLIMKNLIPN
jgi:hypothetical protein